MLFVDLSGFTSFSVREDPEDVRVQIRPLLDGLIHIAELHGAWVSQVEGDGFMALFGVPVVRDNDPERGAIAADRMRRFAAARNGALEVHLGLATGEVFVEYARGSWSVNGSAVNLASRLCDAAGPGEILVDSACAELAGDAVVWAGKREVNLKGFPEPVRALVLDSVWDQVDPELQAVQLAGRGQESRALSRALESVMTSGSSMVVGIVGDPGIGKTSLLSSWMRECGVPWLYGRARGAPFDVPLDPLASAMRGLTALEGRILPGASLDIESSPQLTPWWEVVLGGERSSRAYEGRDGVLAAGFREALKAVGNQGPVVLCLDDVHNAASDLIDWLRDFVDNPLAAPVLVLAGSRNSREIEFLDEIIEVSALDANGARDLVESLVGTTISTEAMDSLIGRTGGNPFFLRASIGWLVASEGRVGWPTLGARAFDGVPESIRLVLEARLDALSPQNKRRLQAASVWGDEGPAEVLSVLASVDVEEIRDEPLSELFGVQLSRWSFAHSLVREVAYSSLPKRDRVALHERLLAVARITQAQRAHHACAVVVLDVAPDSATQTANLRRAAAETLRHVRGIFAIEAGAARDAVIAASEVLNRAGLVAGDDTIELLLVASAALGELAEFEQAEEYAERALSLADSVPLLEARPKALLARARSRSRLRMFTEAEDDAREVIRLTQGNSPDDLSLRARAEMAIGEVHRYDSFQEWIDRLARAYELFDQAGDFDGLGEASRLAAYVLSTTASDQHDMWFARAVSSTESDDLRGRAWNSRSEMFAALARSDWHAAIEAAEEAQALAGFAGLRDIVLDADRLIAEASGRIGQYERAISIRERLLAGLDPMVPDERMVLDIETCTALALSRAGRVSQAAEALSRAAELAPRFGRLEELAVTIARADVAADLGQYEIALPLYEQAASTAAELDQGLAGCDARVAILRIHKLMDEPIAEDLVRSLAKELVNAASQGRLAILGALWPAWVDMPSSGDVLDEVKALLAEDAGRWGDAVQHWATIGATEYLAHSLEMAGDAREAAKVRAILAGN